MPLPKIKNGYGVRYQCQVVCIRDTDYSLREWKTKISDLRDERILKVFSDNEFELCLIVAEPDRYASAAIVDEVIALAAERVPFEYRAPSMMEGLGNW